uniref:spidroin-1-like n=1 Tax=Macaca mulatta TaxID=9544 RepID=UPI0010A29370|nr:spidroin-1-like [Macaca mulatta]
MAPGGRVPAGRREASPRGGRGRAGAAYLGPRRAYSGARRGRRRRELRRRRAAAAAVGFAPCWGFGGGGGGGGGAGARFLVTQAAGPRTHGAGRAGHLFGACRGGRRGREIRHNGARGACADRRCQLLTPSLPLGPRGPGWVSPAPRGRSGRGTMVGGRTGPGSSAHERQGGTFRPPVKWTVLKPVRKRYS